MKAPDNLLKKWKSYQEYGFIDSIVKKTGLSRSTVNKALTGQNVLTCNLIKVNKAINSIQLKKKRIYDEG